LLICSAALASTSNAKDKQSSLDWQLLPAVPRGHMQAALSASTTAQIASFSHFMTSQAPALQSPAHGDMIA